jgi:hypothetical protein
MLPGSSTAGGQHSRRASAVGCWALISSMRQQITTAADQRLRTSDRSNSSRSRGTGVAASLPNSCRRYRSG